MARDDSSQRLGRIHDPMSRREFARRMGGGAMVCAGAAWLHGLACPEPVRAAGLKKGLVHRRPSPYYTRLDEGVVRCDLCPHRCRIPVGHRGRCGVRENTDGQLWTVAFGNPCAVNIDPVEKKPFHHVLPGTKTLSLATAGCNLHCKSCLNWEASQAQPEETFNYALPPADAVSKADSFGCRSIASSYVEPVVFIEYMLEIARLCQSSSLLHLMHSAGFVSRAPLEEVCEVLDAACIDLKGFSESFYQEQVEGSLRPVLETLTTLRDKGVHTEIVNLLIPGKNDEPQTLRAMCRWIVQELGAEVPVHFYRFYPRYLLKSIPPTPVTTLEQARAVAMEAGLHYTYIANIPEHPGKHTYCPQCGQLLIERIGFMTRLVDLVDGGCGRCGHAVPGIWRSRRRIASRQASDSALNRTRALATP